MTKRPVPGGYTLEPLPTPNIGVCTPKCCGWGPRLCRSQGVCRELVSAGELHLQAKRESSWWERVNASYIPVSEPGAIATGMRL